MQFLLGKCDKCSGEYTQEVPLFMVKVNRKIIGPRIKHLDKALPQSLPYDAWFKNKNILTSMIYFQETRKYELWRAQYLNARNGFSFESGFARSGVPADIYKPPASKKDFRADVFETMVDPKVNWIVYNGHSEHGAALSLSLQRAPRTTENILKHPKLIQCASCRSGFYYLNPVKDLYPTSQFVGNIGSADVSDDHKVFAAILNGISKRMSWSEIKADLDAGQYVYPGNYLLPNQA
jgi:hypothetical protein